MFPIRHRRDLKTCDFASPRVAVAMRDGAAVSPEPCNRPAALRRSARDPVDGGRIIGIRRGLAAVVAVVCALAASMTTAAENGHPAQRLVEQVASRVIEELESKRESIEGDPGQLYELVNRLVLPHFDFERMSRRVLGKRWKKATPAQQERFTSAFRTLLVRTYTLVLSEYRGQTITYLDPVARKRDDEIVIPVRIRLSSNQSVIVAYAMQGSGSDWKVFDVAIDGVSLVTNYRSSFRSEVARHGIDGLTARIEARNSAKN